MSTNYSTSVLSYWNAMTKDAILTSGSNKVINYQNYKNELNEAYGNGTYFTFKEYSNSLSGSDYLNAPYTVKYILEDGLLGDVKSYSQENLKVSPSLKSSKSDGNVILSYEKAEDYTNNIETLQVGMNILDKSSYKIEDGKITITDTSKFSKGINEISVLANGYQTNKVSIDLSEAVAELIANLDEDKNVTIELNENHKESISSLSINGKSLFNDSQLGQDKGYYYFVDNTLVLKSKLFEGQENKQQTLLIKANGYEDSVTIFTPSKLSSVETNKKDIPSFVKLNNKNTYKVNDRVIIDVEEAMNSDYKKSIKSVLVDDKEVEYKASLDEFYSIEILGDNFNKTKTYNIAIKADNYKDYEVKVDIQGDEKALPSITVEKNYWGDHIFESEDSSYIENITSVLINGSELKEATSSFASEGFYKNGGKITILTKLEGGDKVVFKSNGYEDYTYNTPLKSIGEISILKNSDGNYQFSSTDYNWTNSIEVYVNNEKLSNNDDYKINYGLVTILKSLKEDDIVTIKSKGYEEYNYTIELFNNKVKAEYSTFNNRHSFNSTDSNWKNKVTSVKINGKEIEETTAFFPTKGYKLNYSGGIDIYDNLENGDKVEIKADGYKDYVFENTKITAKDIELNEGDTFDVMSIVSAIDSEGSDISDKIKVLENTVDTSKAGKYKVTYKVTDSLGSSVSKKITITVNLRQVELNSTPVINGAKDISILIGEEFNVLAGLTAVDEEDGDLTSNIEIIENTVDTNKVGEYTVTYKVTDSNGASSTKTIKITVSKKDVVPDNGTEEDKDQGNNTENGDIEEDGDQDDNTEGENTEEDSNQEGNLEDEDAEDDNNQENNPKDDDFKVDNNQSENLGNSNNDESSNKQFGSSTTNATTPTTGQSSIAPYIGMGIAAIGGLFFTKRKKR